MMMTLHDAYKKLSMSSLLLSWTTLRQTVVLSVIWYAMTPMWFHCNVIIDKRTLLLYETMCVYKVFINHACNIIVQPINHARSIIGQKSYIEITRSDA